jgi:glycosyltransferase involved in cell wall biosynthesis
MSDGGSSESLDTVPVVLCIDAEPDQRVLQGRSPEPCAGLERLLDLIPELRARLSAASDRQAEFTWLLRIDPQIGEVYGSSTWLITEYEQAWSRLGEDGDDFGVHPHTWRWKDGWVADHADSAWVAHCSAVAIDGYREAFNEPPPIHRHGDGFMTTALSRHLDDQGVLVDLSLEPGRGPAKSLAPGEETTGWLPDTRSVPTFAYRPARDDFRAPDNSRRQGLAMLPLTPGVKLALTEVRSRVVGAGEYAPLWLWRDPAQFRAMLQLRLAAPALTHLAFAVRSDTALNQDLWTNVDANLAELGRQLKGQHHWCTARRAAVTALDRMRDFRAQPEEAVMTVEARARQWLQGRDDPGFRDHINLSALALGPGHPLASPPPPALPLTVTSVLPVYRGRRHLRGAVQSVVDQTSPPVELIVIDDGSTEDDLDFLHSVAAPFPIRIVRQKNAGQSAARNLGVELAASDLVAFLDQDDVWLPEHLELLCRPFHSDPSVAWSYSEFDEIDSEGRMVTRGYLREHGIDHPKDTLGACLGLDLMVLPSASVVRRDAFIEIGGFDTNLRGFEDDDLYVRAFRAGWQFSFHGTPLTRFRVHGDGDSASPNFAASRRRFAQKLERTVRDDRRSGRYYVRDVVAPRFFQASLDDYVRAVCTNDWATAEQSLRDLRYFGRLRRDWLATSWRVWLMGRPRLFARMLRLHDSLPRSLRVTNNPAVRQR